MSKRKILKLGHAARKYKLPPDRLEREIRSGRLFYLIAGDAILFNERLQSQQDRWYRNRNIEAALIIAAITVVGWFVNPYINKQFTSPQKNVSTSPDAETRGNLSPSVVTYSPNSPVNIFMAPSQPDSNTITQPSKPDHDKSNSLPDLNLSHPESPNQ